MPLHPLVVSIICRMRSRPNRAATIVLKFIGRPLFLFVLLCAVSMTYSTARGYTTWWFSLRGLVAVDGVRGGYLHRNWDHSAVIITRTDLHPSQSYLVWLPGKRSLIHCGDWHAPRLPAFPIGDVNPPCLFGNGAALLVADNAVLSTLSAQPGSVEFQTETGKRVTASW